MPCKVFVFLWFSGIKVESFFTLAYSLYYWNAGKFMQ
jgi:hypothetical protein